MMRLFTILLLSVLLMQTFSKVAIFVNYEINKKQITEKYCINKSKPMAHCNGMCHMIKQLQKEDKQEKAPLRGLNEQTELQLFSQIEDESLFDIYLSGDYTYPFIQCTKITSPVSFIFHPPTI
jgi:ribosomal protein S26